MNKIAIYILIILVYLGLSKSFAPTELGIIYIPNKHVYNNYFKRAPMSLVLVDQFSRGFLIKSYFHRYHAVYLFRRSSFYTVKVSKDFYRKNEQNLGMSLFRRKENDFTSTLPLPPGSLYIGDKSFGNWSKNKEGRRVWKLHGAYNGLVKKFRWFDFRPNKSFYKSLKTNIENDVPFYGKNQEFGTNGTITKVAYPHYFQKKDESPNFKKYLEHYYEKSMKNRGKPQKRKKLMSL